MSEIEFLLSLSLCCFNCGECLNTGNSSKKDEDKEDKEDKITITFFYNEVSDKIDQNIHRIIFYEEYNNGFYDSYKNNIINILSKKNILLINNKTAEQVGKILDFIKTNKGLSFDSINSYLLNTQKWTPENIWVFCNS